MRRVECMKDSQQQRDVSDFCKETVQQRFASHSFQISFDVKAAGKSEEHHSCERYLWGTGSSFFASPFSLIMAGELAKSKLLFLCKERSELASLLLAQPLP